MNADEELAQYLVTSANRLINAGADLIAICCNSAHRVAAQVMERIDKPLIDIRDAVADTILQKNISCVALLGTKFTMGQKFYKGVLEKRGIRCLTPEPHEQQYINDLIMNELSVGVVSGQARDNLVTITNRIVGRGAGAIVLACTELPLIVSQGDFGITVIDTVKSHCDGMCERAIGEFAA